VERAQGQRRQTRPRRAVTSVAALAAGLIVSVVFSAAAQAAPGDLDPTFSGDGKQTTDFRGGQSKATATVLQPDGKIVAVGSVLRSTSGDNSFSDFALARYNPNGSLDTSFSGDGKLTTDFAGIGADDKATGVALQDNGKIVVVGYSGISSKDFAVARYNPNGTLDTSFSGDGKQTTDFGGGEGASGVAIQGNGKIVVVGTTCTDAEFVQCDFALARYNPSDGSLDTSFSGDGKQTTDFGTDYDTATGMALQGDGKIVAVGARGFGTGASDFALARYNPSDGSLDTSFSGDGKQTTDFGGGNDGANGVAVQGGKIVAVGQGGSGLFYDFALARYKSNGLLDTTFAGDGKLTTDFGGDNDRANGVAIQGDGKIVAVGDSFGNGFVLARYRPNGSLDPSFSGDGEQMGAFNGVARGVAIQDDGKIVAVGDGSDAISTDFAVARYNPNGSLDPSFSDDGRQRTNFGGIGEGATGVAVQGDGKIVAVGHNRSGFFALARYSPNGSLDPSFSEDGKRATDFGGGPGAAGVVVQANGKIVVVGGDDHGRFALARYKPNGTLDTSFSGDGKQTTGFAGLSNGATGVAIQGDGKIVAVGDTVPGFERWAIARYNPNGSLDKSFSGDGRQTTAFGTNGGGAKAVALQANGRIVVAGTGGSAAGDFGLARYNPNGTLDPSFSGDGRQTTDFAGGPDDAAAVAVQANGKIVAVGQASFGIVGNDFALARYNPNGSLDTNFSGDGKQSTDFGSGDAANGVALQSDGKIVAAGRGPGGSGYAFALARYSPNGSLDPSFSGDGMQTTDLGAGVGATGVALQGDGKIVAVGTGLGPTQTGDFAVARYLGG
jgi:uncharacterized delta-60 repeat protein